MSELKTNLELILQEKTEKIISQNIKKNVEVLGVTGSYDKEDIKELQDELDAAEAELAAVRRDLENSSAEVSGSGENVALNGTTEARFKKPPLPEGNTKQKSTTGKQMIDTLPVKSGQPGYTMINDNRGIIVDMSTSSDRYFFIKENFESMTTKAYTIAFEASGKNSETIEFTLWGAGTMFTLKNGRNVCVIPQGTAINNNRILWDDQNNLGIKTSILTFTNFMMVEGQYTEETMPEYEAYTGGQASPNPGYPQEINNVTGDVNVLVENKNLFSSIWEQGAIDSGSGNNVSTDQIIRVKDYIEVKQNTKYSISRSISTDYFNVRGYDKNKNYIGSGGVATTTIVGNNDGNPMLSGRKFCVIETEENVCYLRFNDASNDLSTKYMMVEGQYTEETMPSYIPHQERVLPLSLKSKNLLDLNEFEKVTAATTITILESGINIKNVTTGYGCKIVISNLKQNTDYYLQYTWKNISNGINKVTVFAGTSQTTAIYYANSLSGFTFNTGANTTINIWFYAALDQIAEVEYTNIQLEQSSIATSYEPYYDVKAMQGTTLEDDGIHQASGEYTFTGNENWLDYTTQTENFYKAYTTEVRLGRTNSMEARADAFCTHFINNNFYGDNSGIGLTKNATYISIDKTIASTPAELKTWLATQYNNGNPVKIQYTLETEEIIPYKGIQQSQYNVIKNTKSYYGQTNISSNTIALFDVIAYRDMNAILSTLDNEITLLE